MASVALAGATSGAVPGALVSPRPLTPVERHCLMAVWPVERPRAQPTPSEVTSLVALGLMYIDDVGNGWNRYGLTDEGRELARNPDWRKTSP